VRWAVKEMIAKTPNRATKVLSGVRYAHFEVFRHMEPLGWR